MTFSENLRRREEQLKGLKSNEGTFARWYDNGGVGRICVGRKGVNLRDYEGSTLILV